MNETGQGQDSMGGGYDISQSTSEAATLGSTSGSGAFQVGGGFSATTALILGAAMLAMVFLFKKVS